MRLSTPSINIQPLLLDVSIQTLHVTPAEFDRLCVDNPDLRLELTKDGELIIMSPAFGESGEKMAICLGRSTFGIDNQN